MGVYDGEEGEGVVSSEVVWASQRYAWKDAFRYYIQLGLEYCAYIDYMSVCYV